MKIELRRVQYSARLSQETAAFAADVYVDGVKAGTAENAGHGGMTSVSPHALERRLQAYAETLPPFEAYGVAGLTHSADSLVDDALDEYLTLREFRRALKSKMLFTVAGKPGIYQVRLQALAPANDEAVVRPRLRVEGRQADKILNFMPEAEALALYRSKP